LKLEHLFLAHRIIMFRSLSQASQTTKVVQSRGYATAGGYTFQTSQLKNGIRVVTASLDSAPATSVGLYVNGGSRLETPKTLGASGVFRRLAFKGNNKFSELRLAREFELLPGTFEVGVGKEHVVFQTEFAPEQLAGALELLGKASNPDTRAHVIRLGRDQVEQDTYSNEADPRSLLLDLLHREAYRYAGLGRSTFAPSQRVHQVDEHIMDEYLRTAFQNRSATLVATGNVDHAAFVQSAETQFGSRQVGASNNTASSYHGGEFKVYAESDTHFGLAFEGAATGSADEHASALARVLFGGGRKLRDFGMGQGHTSRLYHHAVKSDSVDSLESFNLNYSDSGLIGVVGKAAHGKTKDAVDQVVKGLASFKSTPASEEELAKAKESFKAETFFKTESRSGLSEFLAQQNGKSPAEYVKAVEKLTAEDLNKFIKKATSSHPTLVVVGEDIEEVATPAEIQKLLK